VWPGVQTFAPKKPQDPEFPGPVGSLPSSFCERFGYWTCLISAFTFCATLSGRGAYVKAAVIF
jgi:hypothetical protein